MKKRDSGLGLIANKSNLFPYQKLKGAKFENAIICTPTHWVKGIGKDFTFSIAMPGLRVEKYKKKQLFVISFCRQNCGRINADITV